MGTAGCCDFQGELWDIIMANCAARCLFLAVLSNIRTLTGEETEGQKVISQTLRYWVTSKSMERVNWERVC